MIPNLPTDRDPFGADEPSAAGRMVAPGGRPTEESAATARTAVAAPAEGRAHESGPVDSSPIAPRRAAAHRERPSTRPHIKEGAEPPSDRPSSLPRIPRVPSRRSTMHPRNVRLDDGAPAARRHSRHRPGQALEWSPRGDGGVSDRAIAVRSIPSRFEAIRSDRGRTAGDALGDRGDGGGAEGLRGGSGEYVDVNAADPELPSSVRELLALGHGMASAGRGPRCRGASSGTTRPTSACWRRCPTPARSSASG